MRDLLGRLLAFLPLSFFALLAALSYWLDLATRSEDGRPTAKNPDAPDAIVERFTARKSGPDGSPAYTLTAERMRHFPDERSEILRPELVWHRQPPTFLTAKTARIQGKGETVELIDEVLLRREAQGNRAATVLTTSHLTVWPEEEIARGDAPVAITQGQSRLTGSAFSANQKTGLYALAGPVQGLFFRSGRNAFPSTRAAKTDKVLARDQVVKPPRPFRRRSPR